MKRYAWLGLVALLGCGGAAPSVEAQAVSAFTHVSRDRIGDNVLDAVRHKNGACFVVATNAYTGAGLAIHAAPSEVCE